MKLKMRTYLVLFLTLFPVFIICVSLFLLPEQIIYRYSENRHLVDDGTTILSGLPLSMGSKYTLLRLVPWPLIAGLEYFFSKRKEKRDQSASLSLTLGALIVFNLVAIYEVLLAVCNPSFDQVRLTYNGNLYWVFVGIGLLSMGNSIPKFSFFGDGGPHSSYARENEVVFRKSKLIHSISLIVTGVVLILANLVVLAPNQGTYFSLLCLGLGGGCAWLATRNTWNKQCS